MVHVPPNSVIENWPTPNYVDPVTRGCGLYVLLSIMSALMILAVGGRIYSRFVVKKWFGWDDGLIIPAVIFALGLNAVIWLATSQYGWDRHTWDIKIDTITNTGICALVTKLCYITASTFCRLSLICFYYRLVRDSTLKWFYKVLHVCLILNGLLGFISIFIGIFACTPIQAYWIWPVIPNSYCLDEGTELMVIGGLVILADLITTILPIPLVMQLQMPMRQRIGACVLLSLGLASTVAGIVRAYYVWVSFYASWDITWWIYPTWVCAVLELDVAVLCACAPALKSLFKDHVKALPEKISAKLSALRSTSDRSMESRDSETHKAVTFLQRPFRTRSKSSRSEWDEEAMYYTDYSDPAHKYGVTVGVRDHSLESSTPGTERKVPSPPPAFPRLEIMMQHSVDQETTIAEGVPLSPGNSRFNPRDSNDAIAWRSKCSITVGHKSKSSRW